MTPLSVNFAASAFDIIHSLSPDGAVLLASLGLLLIFLEFNRPGRVLPAGAGLVLLLLTSAVLFRFGLQLWSVCLLAAVAALSLFNLYRGLPSWLLLLITGGWVVSLRFLVHPHGANFVHTPVALGCGGLLGIVSGVLTRIAYRARRAKALN